MKQLLNHSAFYNSKMMNLPSKEIMHTFIKFWQTRTFVDTSLGDFIIWCENELVVERLPIEEAFLTDALEFFLKFLGRGTQSHMNILLLNHHTNLDTCNRTAHKTFGASADLKSLEGLLHAKMKNVRYGSILLL